MKNKYRYTLEVPPEFKDKFERIKKLTGKSYNLQAQEALRNYFKVSLKKGD